MILSTMTFLLAVSVLASAAALLVEEGLGRMSAATRFAWLGALALGPVLLGAGALGVLRSSAPADPPAWAPVLEMPALLVGPPGGATPGPGMGEVAALVWVLSGVGLLLLVLRTHRALLRERAGWESTRIFERDVYLSTDRGPAVAGVWDPWIVLPRWVLALPEPELRMVLLHEAEHMRARDTHLLGVGLGLVAMSAWNPVTWWQLRRLRAAMEVDCDRRVLRGVPDRATYGASLLTVAARASGPSLGLAAFTERSLNLKRRILAMTAKTSRRTALGGGVLVALGLVVGVQACGVETPVGPAPTAGAMPVARPAPTTAPNLEDGPVPTPFTVAPSILNRGEVVEALAREYPPLLREAGVTGTARVYFLIGAEGNVVRSILDVSSGHPALDDAALRIASVYRFSPALNRDEKVPAWVSFPITFQLAGPAAERPTVSAAPAASAAPAVAPSTAVAPEPATLAEIRATPTFTPFTQAPSIVNRQEVVEAMVSEYPAELRAAGVAGTVRVYFLIDEEGAVAEVRLDRGSGNSQLDEAAMRVARVYRFGPAQLRDVNVPVWVAFPITFQVR